MGCTDRSESFENGADALPAWLPDASREAMESCWDHQAGKEFQDDVWLDLACFDFLSLGSEQEAIAK